MKKSHKPIYRTGIGQDSHRFLSPDTAKPCILGGVIFENTPGFQANSDGDVLLHALCNAISSLTGIPILGKIADELCLKDGITDSRAYVREALKTLEDQLIIHVAFTIEGKRPRILEKIPQMQKSIAFILEINPEQVGITATTGEGLTDFGCGDGLQCFCILTTVQE